MTWLDWLVTVVGVCMCLHTLTGTWAMVNPRPHRIYTLLLVTAAAVGILGLLINEEASNAIFVVIRRLPTDVELLRRALTGAALFMVAAVLLFVCRLILEMLLIRERSLAGFMVVGALFGVVRGLLAALLVLAAVRLGMEKVLAERALVAQTEGLTDLAQSFIWWEDSLLREPLEYLLNLGWELGLRFNPFS